MYNPPETIIDGGETINVEQTNKRVTFKKGAQIRRKKNKSEILPIPASSKLVKQHMPAFQPLMKVPKLPLSKQRNSLGY